MMLKCYALLAALLSGFSLFSGTYHFQHYQVENGVANNWIICMEQDHLGFMWFGTMEGLNRFDGYSFKTLRPNEQVAELPKTCFILSLLEDRRRRLWVGSTVGLFAYSFRTETFELIPGSRNKPVTAVFEARNGEVYFLMEGRLYRYDAVNKGLRLVVNGLSLTTMSEDAAGNLWLGTADGQLVRYMPSSGKSVRFDMLVRPAERMSGMIHVITETADSTLLIGTSGMGLLRFDPRTGKKEVLLSHDGKGLRVLDVREILQTGRDEYWIASESGLFIYDVRARTFTNLRKSYTDPNQLSDDAIHSLFKDKAGGIWIGTYSGGINYYANSSFEFRRYYVNGRDDGLGGNYVNRIQEDRNGFIWIGTGDNGLNRLDPRTGKVTRFAAGESGGPVVYKNVQGLSVAGDEVWVGTYFHGLEVLDLNGNQLRQPPDLAALKDEFIVYLYHLKSGDLLAGTENALLRRRPEGSGSRPKFEQVKEVPTGLPICFAILEDSEGTVWAGTKGAGVFYYNTRWGKKGQFRFDPKDSTSLGSDFINDIFEDSAGNIWISTDGGGLCLLDRRTGTFRRFTTASGFSSNYIQKVLEDTRGVLWITSTRGLMRWNRKKETVEVFTRKHGLLSDQFIAGSGCRARDGTLYFGSAKGLISLNAEQMVDFSGKNPIYITDFQVDNQSLAVDRSAAISLDESILLAQKVTLPYNRSTFSLRFSALDFGNAQALTYHYRLEGLDDRWTTIKDNRRVYFTSVPPGEYTFKIYYDRGQALHSGKSATLKIRITPPFWATPLARAIYALVAVALLYWALRYYQQFQMRKSREKLRLLQEKHDKELYEAKLDFLGNVAHELNTPLTLIRGPLEEMVKHATPDCPDKKNLLLMEKNVDRLMRLTSELLDFRKSELNAYWLNFTRVDLSELIKITVPVFEPETLKKGITFSVHYPDHPCFVSGDAEALRKIFTNLLSNAFKYAANEIRVSLAEEIHEKSKMYRFEVSNDGLLIPPESGKKIFEPFVRLKQHTKIKGTGLGLSISKTLAEMHRASLYWEPGSGKYNVFVFVIAAAVEPLHFRQPQF